MKNVLIGIIVLPVLAMPYTYYYLPSLKNTASMKQEIANYKASLDRVSNGRFVMYNELLKIHRENLEKEKKELNYMLPAFDSAKANLMAPFDTLREKIPGDWSVVPEGKFRVSSPLVFWAFNFKFKGTFSNAIKVLSHMEVNNQFMRISNYRMETDDDLVMLSGQVELVFQEKIVEDGEKK